MVRDEVQEGFGRSVADRLEYPGYPAMHERCESLLVEEAGRAGPIIQLKQRELVELGQAAEPLECLTGDGVIEVRLPGCTDSAGLYALVLNRFR